MIDPKTLKEFLEFMKGKDIELREEGDDYIGDEEIYISTYDPLTECRLDELIAEFNEKKVRS